MTQLNDMLPDIEIADPAVEAVLSTLSVTEEMAFRFRVETEMFESETRQILLANHVLKETALSSVGAVEAAVALAKRWRL